MVLSNFKILGQAAPTPRMSYLLAAPGAPSIVLVEKQGNDIRPTSCHVLGGNGFDTDSS
jgi:hypothetical protein